MAQARGSKAPAKGRLRSLAARVSRGLDGLDAVSVVFMSWWLSLVAIFVLQQAHAGLHERLELPPVLHLVRDAAFAVPFAAFAVVASAAVVGRGSRAGATPTNGHRLVWAIVAAAVFALLSIPGAELHDLLAGAEETEVSWLADRVLDAAIAFSGAQIALLALALVLGPPTRRSAIPSPTTALVADPGWRAVLTPRSRK